MTEAEWLAGDDPVLMLRAVRRAATDRKLRLFGCACCRRAWHLIPDRRSRRAVEVVERLVDGAATRRQVALAETAAANVHGGDVDADVPHAVSILIDRDQDDPVGRVVAVAGYVLDSLVEASARVEEVRPGVEEEFDDAGVGDAEYVAQAYLLRCIFGNPFRPVAVDPAWLTSTVVALARGIYEERAFDRMPILADALQDAGCDNDDILNHCRGDGPHVRGCWVVDLVLGTM